MLKLKKTTEDENWTDNWSHDRGRCENLASWRSTIIVVDNLLFGTPISYQNERIS